VKCGRKEGRRGRERIRESCAVFRSRRRAIEPVWQPIAAAMQMKDRYSLSYIDPDAEEKDPL